MSDPYHCWQIPVKNNFPQLNTTEQLSHLLEWGMLAANAHNAQSWRCRIHRSKNRIDLFLAPEDCLVQTDKQNRQAITSIGCFIENIFMAARCYNCAVEFVEASANMEQSALVAALIIDCSSSEPPSLEKIRVLNSIKNRKSNRLKYKQDKIPEELVSEVRQKAAELGITFFVISDTTTRLAISEFQYMADRAVVALPGFREELLQHLIENQDLTSNKGMPGHSFGLSDQSTLKLRRDLVEKGGLNPDWAVGFATAARDGIRSAPLLIIGCGKDDTNNWLNAGRLFQFSASRAEAKGIATAYNAAMVESGALNSMLKIRIGTFLRPLCIFRLGYPLYEAKHSPRRDLNEILEYVE